MVFIGLSPHLPYRDRVASGYPIPRCGWTVCSRRAERRGAQPACHGRLARTGHPATRNAVRMVSVTRCCLSLATARSTSRPFARAGSRPATAATSTRCAPRRGSCPRSPVIALGGTEAKTNLLASMYHRLATAERLPGFRLQTGLDEAVHLANLYSRLCDPDGDWPPGTLRGETRSFTFECVVSAGGAELLILNFNYFDYSGRPDRHRHAREPPRVPDRLGLDVGTLGAVNTAADLLVRAARTARRIAGAPRCRCTAPGTSSHTRSARSCPPNSTPTTSSLSRQRRTQLRAATCGCCSSRPLAGGAHRLLLDTVDGPLSWSERPTSPGQRVTAWRPVPHRRHPWHSR